MNEIELQDRNSEEENNKEEPSKLVSFLGFAKKRFLLKSSSVYVDGIIGGVFLNHLLHDDNDCQEEDYTHLFFLIGILHFLCGLSERLSEYASFVFGMDGSVSKTEEVINRVIFALRQFLRLVQFIPIPALGYYVLLFNGYLGEEWTFDKSKMSDSVSFCSRAKVHNAEMCFFLHIILAAATVLMWFTMWLADRDDEKQEKLEDLRWKKATKESKKSIFGRATGALLQLGSRELFDESLGNQMLTLAISKPNSACKVDEMIHWFLFIGIINCFSRSWSDMMVQVKDMAEEDGVVNKIEHFVMYGMKIVKLGLFCFEVSCMVYINYTVISFWASVDKKDTNSETYCDGGIWKLMEVVLFGFSNVLLIRILVILASEFGPKSRKK